MEPQPKKRSLPASLVASTAREQHLPATLRAVANTHRAAARVDKRERRLPSSLVADIDNEQQSLPELTLSNVRVVLPNLSLALVLSLSQMYG